MTNTAAIRVMIVDDHSIVRSALALMIRSAAGFVLAGQAADGKEAIMEERSKYIVGFLKIV